MKFKLKFTVFCILNSLFCSAQVLINEVYLLPEGVKTNQEFFVEFYNPTKLKLDLDGYILEVYNLDQVLISSQKLSTGTGRGAFIYPNNFNYAKINRVNDNPNFIFLQLKNNDSYFFKLLNPSNQVSDFIKISNMTNGKSFGRYPDGSDNWGISLATKKSQNKSHLNGSFKLTINELLLSNESDTIVKDKEIVATDVNGKLKINEVFYVRSNDILNKDSWIELINTSKFEIPMEGILLSTDTVYGKQSFVQLEGKSIQPNEVVLIYLSNQFEGASSLYSLNLIKKSNTIKVFYKDAFVDSVEVPVLDRDESFARIPDGSGEFLVVKYETPGQSNAQLMPGDYTKPSFIFLHTLGVAVSNYKFDNKLFDSKSRIGSCMGFSLQHTMGYFDLRHSIMYKRQGFRLSTDTVLYTPVGKLVSTTEGYQRMEYLGYSGEIGVPITRKLEMYYGLDFDIRLNNVSDITITQVGTLNTGEEVSRTEIDANYLAIGVDNIDLNLSFALEYKFSKYAYLNASIRSDFGGLNFSTNYLFNDPQITNDQVRGRWIKTHVFQMKLVFPFYSSDKLVHKAYLFKLRD